MCYNNAMEQETGAAAAVSVDVETLGEGGRLDGERTGGEGVTVRASPGKQLEPYLWQPGQSGNPAGRSKKDILMIDTLAQSFPPHVIAAHIQDVIDRASPKTKIEAIKLLLLYLVGRPGVTITHEKGPGAIYLEMMKSIPAGSIVAGSVNRAEDGEQ
jgi:hypothetical protein